MSVQLQSVLIIGGGFSGLAAAIALAQEGRRITLVEREPEWRMDGAGISIGGASLRALHALGVLEGFLERGYAADGTDMRGPDGSPLARFPTPRLVNEDTPGNGAIMRPFLGEVLAEAALVAGTDVRFATTPTELREDTEHTLVTLSGPDGERTETFDLVVAADGVFSQTRRTLFPEAPEPRFSGQGAWRAVLPRPAAIGNTTIWVGRPSKIGVNPIDAERLYLFVNEASDERERIPEEQLIPRLDALLAPLPDPLVQELRASIGPDALVLHRPMDQLLVPLPWHRGRVQLIGDAVHATTPHLAAGAGLGLEDALVLAEELEAHSMLDDALGAFEARRWERARMVVENSARLGELEAAPEGAPAFGALQAESMRLLAQPI